MLVVRTSQVVQTVWVSRPTTSMSCERTCSDIGEPKSRAQTTSLHPRGPLYQNSSGGILARAGPRGPCRVVQGQKPAGLGRSRQAGPKQCSARTTAHIDGTKVLPYKPRQSRDAGSRPSGFTRAPSRFLTCYVHPVYVHPAAGCEEESREADLSTEQAGAQAPARLPDPYGHQGRTPGAQCAPGAWPQAAQRVSGRRAGSPRSVQWNN